MNANDLIESYVNDVAARLPRRQRNDVAFELRALLREELQARAEAAGRGADAAMAIELLHGFGGPSEVAARYRPALTIIDPADGQRFLQATVIGLAIIWGVGLLQSLQQPIGSGWDLLSVLGQWWGGTVIPSLWWPGVLVVGFGISSWVHRRWPGGRAAMVMGLAGILCGVLVLIDPTRLLDIFYNGQAAPAAYEALTYTDTFLHRQAPWLLGLLLLNFPLYITVIVKGRWPAWMRRLEDGLVLVTCAAMTWTVLDGPVLRTPAGDQTARFLMALIVVFTLIYMGVKLHRSVRPMPGHPSRQMS
jgi:hypothetical protein